MIALAQGLVDTVSNTNISLLPISFFFSVIYFVKNINPCPSAIILIENLPKKYFNL